MYALKYEHHFDAAHQLLSSPSVKSKECLKLHGHRWDVIIEMKTNRLRDGMIIDFKHLKEIIDEYDHKELNPIVENPTAENIAKKIWNDIRSLLRKKRLWRGAYDLEVTIKESPNSSITYHGGDDSDSNDISWHAQGMAMPRSTQRSGRTVDMVMSTDIPLSTSTTIAS